MKKIASYILATYSFIFTNPLDDLLKVGYESDDPIPIPSFEEHLLIDLCSEVQKNFQIESNLLELSGDVIVVGDIHGSLHDFLRIVNFVIGKRSKVLFLGDYVDRGNFSLECITILFSLKVMYPQTFFLIRGNHEFDQLCTQYGFKDEIINYHNPKKRRNTTKPQQYVQTLDTWQNDEEENLKYEEFYANYKNNHCYKYSEALYNAFINVFSYLPVAAVINEETFCIHGGLSPKLDQLDNIKYLIKRPIQNFEECPLLTDLVWSDPTYCPSSTYSVNTRGRGFLFNSEAVNCFLKKNSLKRIIRAHECVENGTFKNFGDKCMTVFSASSYDKYTNNNSGIIQFFERDGKFKISTFVPLPRLQKSEAIYYKVQPLIQNEENNRPCFSLLHPKLFSKVLNSRNSSIKLSSDNFFPIQRNQGKIVHLVRPKFTTSRRQSYQCIKRPSLLEMTQPNSDNKGEHKRKCCSGPQSLPESLFSFSDSNFLSDE